jgi:hypothetical protein
MKQNRPPRRIKEGRNQLSASDYDDLVFFLLNKHVFIL